MRTIDNIRPELRHDGWPPKIAAAVIVTLALAAWALLTAVLASAL